MGGDTVEYLRNKKIVKRVCDTKLCGSPWVLNKKWRYEGDQGAMLHVLFRGRLPRLDKLNLNKPVYGVQRRRSEKSRS